MEINVKLLIMPFFLGVVSSYALEYVHLRMPGALTVLAHARSLASRWVPVSIGCVSFCPKNIQFGFTGFP